MSRRIPNRDEEFRARGMVTATEAKRMLGGLDHELWQRVVVGSGHIKRVDFMIGSHTMHGFPIEDVRALAARLGTYRLVSTDGPEVPLTAAMRRAGHTVPLRAEHTAADPSNLGTRSESDTEPLSEQGTGQA